MKKDGINGRSGSRSRKKIFIVIFLALAVLAVFFTFAYTPACKNRACWETKLEKCSKASYLNDITDIAWLYTINGKSGDKCIVNVKAVEIKQGLTSSIILQGKGMKCSLPLGTIANPQSDPNLCTGELKEEMQNLIIQKLHQYILQNIGSISENLLKIEESKGNSSLVK